MWEGRGGTQLTAAGAVKRGARLREVQAASCESHKRWRGFCILFYVLWEAT